MKEAFIDSERQDSQANRAKIRKALLRFVKKELRKPSVQELVELTGLSDKTVKAHLKRIKLGTGGPNPYQALTHDVMMAIHARAVGYSHETVKIMTTTTTGVGSSIEQVPYTKQYAPDAGAAKLWMQLVEGFSEKTQHEHSGEVKNPGPPSIIQVQRYRPDADGTA